VIILAQMYPFHQNLWLPNQHGDVNIDTLESDNSVGINDDSEDTHRDDLFTQDYDDAESEQLFSIESVDDHLADNDDNNDDNNIEEDDDDDDDEDEEAENEEEHLTEADLSKLTNKDLKKKLAARGLLQHGRKKDLIQRILYPVDTDFKSKPKGEKWKNSKAKALLIRLLLDSTSDIHNKSPEEVWESSEWFQKFPMHRFVGNLMNIKETLEVKGKVVKEDILLIEAELAALKLSNMTKRGYPHWHTHAAKKLLADDVMLEQNKAMKPKDFRVTRQEYKEFPLDVFRSHIYQEQRKQRELPLKIAKRNRIAQKKYEQEVEAEAARWHAASRVTAAYTSIC
jgi:hypothetical protein